MSFEFARWVAEYKKYCSDQLDSLDALMPEKDVPVDMLACSAMLKRELKSVCRWQVDSGKVVVVSSRVIAKYTDVGNKMEPIPELLVTKEDIESVMTPKLVEQPVICEEQAPEIQLSESCVLVSESCPEIQSEPLSEEAKEEVIQIIETKKTGRGKYQRKPKA